MAQKKMVSIRINKNLLEHVKGRKDCKRFTEYVESALIAKSKFKVKEINKQP